MHTNQIFHLLMKEMMNHITKKDSKIVVLDIDEYHNLINNALTDETRSRLQKNEGNVARFFGSIRRKPKQLVYLFSESQGNTISLYARRIECVANQVVAKHTIEKIEIHFDRNSIEL